MPLKTLRSSGQWETVTTWGLNVAPRAAVPRLAEPPIAAQIATAGESRVSEPGRRREKPGRWILPELSGYACLFRETYDRPDGIRETFAPGAFAGSLANLDASPVVLCRDHDGAQTLARTDLGNLRLGEDSTGLRFAWDIASDALSAATLSLYLNGPEPSGKLLGCSFNAFEEEWTDQELYGCTLRTVTRATLVEVTLAITRPPAYSATRRFFRLTAPPGMPMTRNPWG